MKLLHEYRAAHALWVMWDVEFDEAIHFLLDTRKGQGRVKEDQISKPKISCKNMPILSSFVSGLQKTSFIFQCEN